MSIVTIDQSQHQVLRETAQPVIFPLDDTAKKTIQALKDMLIELESPYGKPAGLAAPQMGVSQQIFILQIPEEAKQRRKNVYDILPPTIFINPSYTPIESDGKNKDWEGCYSVPDKMGEVNRYNTIEFVAHTEDGEKINLVAKGFLARGLQHETDHLHGKLYTDYDRKDCRFGDLEAMMNIRQEEFVRGDKVLLNQCVRDGIYLLNNISG